MEEDSSAEHLRRHAVGTNSLRILVTRLSGSSIILSKATLANSMEDWSKLSKSPNSVKTRPIFIIMSVIYLRWCRQLTDLSLTVACHIRHLHSLRFAKWLFLRLRFTFMSLFFTLTYLILAFLVIVEIIYNDVFPTFSLSYLLPASASWHVNGPCFWRPKQVKINQASSSRASSFKILKNSSPFWSRSIRAWLFNCWSL